MYIPEHFRIRHHEDVIAFMRANPFAILISVTQASPYATHLPLFVESGGNAAGNSAADSTGEKLLLRGHVARANPHWRYLEENPQCLTIFHGPHAYISPSNYEAQESVPTWNYAAVHLYGEARIVSDEDGVHHILEELMETFEPAYREQWEKLNSTFRENMLRNIVGFEITATTIEGKFKLSQNRPRQDQSNVMHSLAKSGDSVISGVGRMMAQQHLGLAEDKEGK